MAHDGRIFYHGNFIGTIVDDESFENHGNVYVGNHSCVAGRGVVADTFSERKASMDSQQAEGGVDRDGDNWVGDHVHCPESD